MAKQPTKAEFANLLRSEIEAWESKIETLTGELKEQAIGRKMELEWLLEVFEGKCALLR